MVRLWTNTIGLCLVVLLAFGCASIKQTTSNTMDELEKIKVRGYVQDKARVDQEISGSVGNWENAPMAEDPERRMTRKIYNLEFTKDADPSPISDEFYEVERAQRTANIQSNVYDRSVSATPQTQPRQDYNLPIYEEASSEYVAPRSSTDYKVEKDDTLQKISKKFYGSYSKWPKIYEANKDVIKDPNFIKPGIVIKIPSME